MTDDERAYALQRHRDIHLRRRQSSVDGPSLQTRDETDAKAVSGLKKMVDLFDLIDERLVDCWNGHCAASRGGPCPNFTRDDAVTFYGNQSWEHLNTAPSETIHQQPNISAKTRSAIYVLPGREGCLGDILNDTQEADLLISRQWLHYRMWQLCLRHRHLVEADRMAEFRPEYMITIARNLLHVCTTSSLSSMEVHGVGLVSHAKVPF
jgi:hypothetical protein